MYYESFFAHVNWNCSDFFSTLTICNFVNISCMKSIIMKTNGKEFFCVIFYKVNESFILNNFFVIFIINSKYRLLDANWNLVLYVIYFIFNDFVLLIKARQIIIRIFGQFWYWRFVRSFKLNKWFELTTKTILVSTPGLNTVYNKW